VVILQAQQPQSVPHVQADWAQDRANFADEETGQVELINTRVNKAVRRCTGAKLKVVSVQ
jgi:hypothetical protein